LSFTKDANDSFSERDLLYRILFDLKRDVNELKKALFDVVKGEGGVADMMKKHPDLFSVPPEESMIMPERYNETSRMLPPTEPVPEVSYIKIDHQPETRVNVVDVTHETEDESLSLERKEKEMILLALRKNRNKRKYAAQALGISERTLYRKIKQYNIDEEE
jgi:DNA-binding NtrC family response regulator